VNTVFAPRVMVLRDGRKVRLRVLLPSDEEELLQAFDRLGPEARYMRFMVAIREPNVERLRTLLASFPEKGFAIGATVPAPDGIDIVGTASFMLVPAGKDCEFAVSVISGWAGAGLGGILLAAVIKAARGRGLARMHGYILASNQPMLKLAARLGFESAPDPDDRSLRIVTLAL
jgi:RimJ/RimL family protein N-acetyltransferase